MPCMPAFSIPTSQPASAPRRSRIVATLGPACSTVQQIRQLVAAGMDVARLNGSHGDAETLAVWAARVRQAATDVGRNVAVLLDLPGPKLRVRGVDGDTEVAADSRICLQPEGAAADCLQTCDADLGLVAPPLLFELDLTPGERVLLRDGLVQTHVAAASSDHVQLDVAAGGLLRDGAGINVPDTDLPVDLPTDRDRTLIRMAADNNDIDWLAVSFVQTSADMLRVRQATEAAGRLLPLVAKVERPGAVQRLATIAKVSDGLMVARGDLGVEIGAARVPAVQRQIVRAAASAGIPVVVATEMFESMVESDRPTRAEVSDVANAVLDGADAVMLSAETAVGHAPAEAVEMMGRVAAEAESALSERDADLINSTLGEGGGRTQRALVAAALQTAGTVQADLLVVATETGRTARLLAGHRPACPLVAFSHVPATVRQLALTFGVTALHMGRVPTAQRLLALLQHEVLQHQLVQPGGRMVVVSGPANQSGATNQLTVVDLPTVDPVTASRC